MVALNFPNSPAIGDTWPNPPVTGIPTYKWDGADWLSNFALGKPMVPLDGSTAMTGLLTLSGDPTAVLNAATKQYVDGLTSNVVSGSVSYAPQSPAAAQQVQARQNIYAAPFDAMAYNGLQVNGAIELSQELGAGGIGLTVGQGKFVADGWYAIFGGTSAGALGVGCVVNTTLPGFSYALACNGNTAAPLAGAGDYALLLQSIEGTRWARLAYGTANAAPVTIAFWIIPSGTGTLAVSVRNAATNRCYVVDVPVVGTGWQYKTVTIPGDITGTWVNTPAAAVSIGFCFGAGSTFKTPANVWTAGNLFATPATSNFVAVSSSVNMIAGVTVLPGVEAPSAARSPYITRLYSDELQLAMRYYERGSEPLTYYSGSGIPGIVNAYYNQVFVVPKRAAPTITFAGTWQYYNTADGFVTFVPTNGGIDAARFVLVGSGMTNWKAWASAGGTWIADARI